MGHLGTRFSGEHRSADQLLGLSDLRELFQPKGLCKLPPCRQTFAEVCVDGHVSCCSSETLVLPVGNVFFGFGVNVLLGQPKVYDVNDVLLLIALPADEEILGLHIPVDEVLGMHVLHPRDLQNHQGDVICEQSPKRSLPSPPFQGYRAVLPALFPRKWQRLFLRRCHWDAAPGRTPRGAAAAFLY